MKLLLYWDWLRAEARTIGSDGCTLVSELYHDCCLQHDVSYFYMRDPTSAYRAYVLGAEKPWRVAEPISRGEADAQFRVCMEAKSPVDGVSPIAWGRWLAVRAFGWNAWRDHRKKGHPGF